MAMKEYFILLRLLELEFPHRMQFTAASKTLVCWDREVLSFCKGCSQPIVVPVYRANLLGLCMVYNLTEYEIW